MKKLLLIFLLLFVAGCTEVTEKEEEKTVEYKISEEKDHNGNMTKFIYFGLYPQTVVTDQYTIDCLTDNGLNDEGYYEYENELYVKEATDLYKDTIFNDGSEAVNNKVYYFKLEPIQFRYENDKLISEYILDTSKFGNNNNVYDSSIIREFINNDILEYFTLEEINTIKVNLIDKVYLLNETNLSNNKDERKSLVSDYAIARYCNSYNRYGQYWLSDLIDETGVKTVDVDGTVTFTTTPNISYIGVKPVIELK